MQCYNIYRIPENEKSSKMGENYYVFGSAIIMLTGAPA